MRYEFYVSPEGDLRVVNEKGNDFSLLTCRNLVDDLSREIAVKFPKAWDASVKEARRIIPRGTSRQWEDMALQRFMRCNFGERDIIPDLHDDRWELEEVKCHLRGICPHENVICHPLSGSLYEEETKHVAMLCEGYDYDDIGSRLKKTASAIRSSFHKVRRRFGLKKTSEVIRKFKGLHLERRFKRNFHTL